MLLDKPERHCNLRSLWTHSRWNGLKLLDHCTTGVIIRYFFFSRLAQGQYDEELREEERSNTDQIYSLPDSFEIF